MYFWRIDRLKDDLRRGPLGQQAAFAYLLATWLLYLALSGLPWPCATDPEPVTALDWMLYAASIILLAGGTYAAYRANGGRAGSDFPSRYLALGWVLLIRFLPLTAALLVVVVVWAAVVGIVAPEGEAPSAAIEYGVSVILVWLGVVYYWRLAAHVGEVASAPDVPADITTRAG